MTHARNTGNTMPHVHRARKLAAARARARLLALRSRRPGGKRPMRRRSYSTR